MTRQYVSSTRIRSVGWDNDILEVEFKNGSVYQYYNVSKQEYISFVNSSSLGSALSQLERSHRYSPV